MSVRPVEAQHLQNVRKLSLERSSPHPSMPASQRISSVRLAWTRSRGRECHRRRSSSSATATRQLAMGATWIRVARRRQRRPWTSARRARSHQPLRPVHRRSVLCRRDDVSRRGECPRPDTSSSHCTSPHQLNPASRSSLPETLHLQVSAPIPHARAPPASSTKNHRLRSREPSVLASASWPEDHPVSRPTVRPCRP